jgi:hypothetical protein
MTSCWISLVPSKIVKLTFWIFRVLFDVAQWR